MSEEHLHPQILYISECSSKIRQGFAWMNNEDIKMIMKRLEGIDWYFVGGCVRDSLLNILTTDIDITTTANPQQIIQSMKGLTIATIGERFGTIGVYVNEWKIEITTTRHDINPDGRHTNIEFTASFYEDSCRRDFTINSLLCDGNKIIDYHAGLKDLADRRVRFIGSALKRIQEDYLRMIRYIRFFYRFSEGEIEYKDEIAASLSGLHHISKERFLSELIAICKCKKSIAAIHTLNDLKLSYNMFSMNLSTYGLQSIHDCGFTDRDYIYSTLFANATAQQLSNIPLSRWAKKMIRCLHESMYSNIILQIAHLYNVNREKMLYFCIMKDMSLYTALKDAVFIKIDTTSFEDRFRGVMQDLYIGAQISCLINGGTR